MKKNKWLEEFQVEDAEKEQSYKQRPILVIMMYLKIRIYLINFVI